MIHSTNCTKKKSYFSKHSIILFIVGLGVSVSCTPKPGVVEGSKTFNADKIAAGKTIYENSCAKCHDLPNPTAHSAQDWVGIMNWMAPKAKLNDEQHALVYDYVVSVKE